MGRRRSKSLSELDNPTTSPFYYHYCQKDEMDNGTFIIKGAVLYTDMGPFREDDVVDLQFDTISSENDMTLTPSGWQCIGPQDVNCYVSGIPRGFKKRICVSFQNTTNIHCVGVEDSDGDSDND
jgi:hypothetical protein